MLCFLTLGKFPMANTITTCSAIHTTEELFIVSVKPSYDNKTMFDLVIEGEGKNVVFITGSKEELSKVASAINRAIANVS